MPPSIDVNDLGKLSVDDRIELIGALWDSLSANPDDVEPTEAQRREVERRLAAHLANPDDVVPWEEVKAQALKRAKR